MSIRPAVQGVYCDGDDCEYFQEFSMDSDRPLMDRMRSFGWIKTPGGGDLCKSCAAKSSAKDEADAKE